MPADTPHPAPAPDNSSPDLPRVAFGSAPARPLVPALRESPPAAPAPGPAPKRQRWRWGAGAVVVTLAAAGLLYLQPWLPAAPVVPVEIVALAPVTQVLAVNGRIAALQTVDVRSVVVGQLESLPVTEGDVVQAGAELALIDAAGQRAVVRQAEAGLEAARAASEQANRTLARTKALAANVPLTQLEADTRAAQSAAQEAERAAAVLDQARIQLENHRVTAPMAGTVLAVHARQGQIVDGASALLTLADLQHLVVETEVDEAFATRIAKGQPAVLQLAGETTIRTGRVGFVSQQVDAGTGGLAFKIGFDSPVAAPVGLTVTANVIVDQRGAALTAPRSALVPDVAGQTVFVLEDGLARQRAVTVQDWPAARLIVTGGLAPGDLLIVDGAGLADGQAVVAAAP